MNREEIARAIASGGADAVLELWHDELERIISELEKEKPSLRQIPSRIRYHGKA